MCEKLDWGDKNSTNSIVSSHVIIDMLLLFLLVGSSYKPSNS